MLADWVIFLRFWDAEMYGFTNLKTYRIKSMQRFIHKAPGKNHSEECFAEITNPCHHRI